jgi:hypothetical protein
MAKGDFDGADSLVTKGRTIQQFEIELQSLRRRWREVHRAGRVGPGKVRTAVWLYYQPILRALAAAGGEALRSELEPQVERLMQDTLQAEDREPMAQGLKRWQVMIRRTRKHLVSEGWIEDGAGPTWRITPFS